MKASLNVFFLLLLCLTQCSHPEGEGEKSHAQSPIPLPIPEGTTSSGGGSAIEMDFKLLGFSLINKKREITTHADDVADLARMESVLNNAKIFFKDEALTKDGKPVTALNFPTLLEVHIHSKSWSKLSPFQKERLVLHELFGLLSQDDFNYERSYIFLEKIGRMDTINFLRIKFSGPAAIELIKQLDWTGVTPINSGVGSHYTSLSIHGKDTRAGVLYCRFTGKLLDTKPIVHWDKEGIELLSPLCTLEANGYMIDQQAFIHISEMNQELWERLCPKGQTGFQFDLISGSTDRRGTPILSIQLTDLI